MGIKLTHTEENYLKAIFKANEKTAHTATTNTIASYINASAASVTDMMKKLANKDLIVYERYKGARLSQSGSKLATDLIRKHRLWETFLVDKLDFSWEEVHDIAEELEHIQSEKLIQKLDEFLGFPKYDPHGDPIPNAEGRFTLREQKSLSVCNKETEGVVVGVKNHETKFLQHLNELSIKLGTVLKIIDKSGYDHSLKVMIDQDRIQTITDSTAQNLLIRPSK